MKQFEEKMMNTWNKCYLEYNSEEEQCLTKDNYKAYGTKSRQILSSATEISAGNN